MPRPKLLLLTATPKDLANLDIAREMQEIRMRAGQVIQLVSVHGVTPEMVESAVRYERPDIVQITAHGSPRGYIMVEHGPNGRDLFAGELAELFAAVASVKLVVLRSCHSFPIAHTIAQRIGLAIGMSASVSDDATIAFVASLYQHLAEGIPVVDAFRRAQRLHEAYTVTPAAAPRLAQASPSGDHRFGARAPVRAPVRSQVRLQAPLDRVPARPFVGRRATLDALHAALNRRDVPLINLVGGAGLGKTTTLTHWLGELRERRWAGAERVHVCSLDPLSHPGARADAVSGWAAEALKFCADELGHGAPTATRVEATGWALGQQLARVLQRRRCLLVLDGLAAPLRFPAPRRVDHAHDTVLDGLLHELRLAGAACPSTVVLSSRAPLWQSPTTTNFVQIQLDPLSASQSNRVLRQLGVAGTDANLAVLAGRSAHQPLALALAAHEVVYHHQGDARAIASPTPDDARGLPWALASFGAQLPARLRARLDGCLLAGGIDGSTEDGELAYLRDYLLASGAATGRRDMFVHPALRAYVESSSPAAGEHWRARHASAADHAEVTGKRRLRHRESLPALLDAIVSAARAGLWAQALGYYFDKLVDDVQRPRMTRELGLIMPALSVIQHFLTEELRPVDSTIGPVEHAILLHHTGLALRHLGCTRAAVAPLGRALELFVELDSCAPRFPNLDPKERAATCANDLAEVHVALGRLDRAVETATRGETLSQHLRDAPMHLRLAHILCLATRAHALRLTGRHDDAGERFASADRLTDDGVLKSRPGHQACLWHLDELRRRHRSGAALKKRLDAAAAWSDAEDIARVTPALVSLCQGLLATHQVAALAETEDRESHRDDARTHFTAAIHGFGATEHVWQLPAAYVASAALRRQCEEWADAELELRRASELAAACEFELDAIDVCLESARLEQALHRRDPQEHRLRRMRELLARARRGIAVTDYQLRQPDCDALAQWLAAHPHHDEP